MSHLRLIRTESPAPSPSPRALRLSGGAALTLPPLGFPAPEEHDETLLLIQSPESLALINRLPRHATIELTRFSTLTKSLLTRLSPHRVLFPLVSDSLDAAEVVMRLHRLRYAGQAVVLMPSLPDPQMVEAELHGNAPGLRLALLTVDG